MSLISSRVNCTAVYPISVDPDANALENLHCNYFGDVEQCGDAQLLPSADVLSLQDGQIEFHFFTNYKYLALQIKNVDCFLLVSIIF
jgi:hypothetical protein